MKNKQKIILYNIIKINHKFNNQINKFKNLVQFQKIYNKKVNNNKFKLNIFKKKI